MNTEAPGGSMEGVDICFVATETSLTFNVARGQAKLYFDDRAYYFVVSREHDDLKTLTMKTNDF